MTLVKEIILDMREIKELLLEIKKRKKLSNGGENSINREEKRVEEDIDNNRFNKDEEEPLHPWFKRVDLPMFEGIDPLGWITRAERFFEVQNTSQTKRLHLALNNMEGNSSYCVTKRLTRSYKDTKSLNKCPSFRGWHLTAW